MLKRFARCKEIVKSSTNTHNGCSFVKNVCRIKVESKKQFGICKTVVYYKSVSSTQLVAKGLAEGSCEDGVVVVAKMQTDGYGRLRRSWDSGVGGLWFSVLLRTAMCSQKASRLTLLFSIALSRILEKIYEVSSEIKWPNDVLISGKKLAGIILEMSAEYGLTNWVVAGVGINIKNNLPENLKDVAISLKEVLKKDVDVARFFVAFFVELEDLYLNFQRVGFEQFFEEYNDKIAYKNEYISVDTGSRVVRGLNLGVDEQGKLVVKTSNGFETLISGTLTKEKL